MRRFMRTILLTKALVGRGFASCHFDACIVDCNGSASVCLFSIMINAEVSLCSAK